MPKGKEGFDKGDPNINRAGRPLGSKNKNKIRWNNLQDLSEWAQETLENLKESDIIAYIKHQQSLLIPKLPSIPATPGESKTRTADDIEAELKKAESDANVKP